MDTTHLSAKDIAQGIKEKKLSAVEVTHAQLSVIEKKNTELNALLEVFDDALVQAERVDDRIAKGELLSPIAGVPIVVKDNILIEGKVASAASKMLANHVAPYDATAIKKLRESGVVFLGRANMDEFAMGSSTENSAYGPSKNPHDTARVPGGSSGGSAAAVAAHMVPVSLGSETCGSVRQPSSLCGVVGLKPTYGAISRNGLIAMGSSLDQIGPFAHTVSDTELFFDAMKGNDSMDATTLPDEGEISTPKNKVVGVPREFVNGAAPHVRAAFEVSLDALRNKGYTTVDIEFPSAPYGLAAYYIVMPAEVSTNLARLDGVRYGLHVEGTDLLDEYKKSRREGFGPETRRRIILGAYVLSSGYYDAYYRRATALRTVIAKDLEKAFADVSYIATPTTPDAAFKIGEKSDPLSMYLEDVFAAPANLTGIPAISVPHQTVVRDGVTLPVGIQFMSPKRTEKTLFAIARDLLAETD